jgi:hypothetical protein
MWDSLDLNTTYAPVVVGIVGLAAIVLFLVGVARGSIRLADPAWLPASILVLSVAVIVLAAVIAMQPRDSGSFCYTIGGSNGLPAVDVRCP